MQLDYCQGVCYGAGMNPLTKQQQRVLDFVKAYIKKNTIPPTRQEISNHFGWKHANAAQAHLDLIERKGAIRLMAGTSRGIVIL